MNRAADPTSETWWVDLSPWILQDGNYTDFVAGEQRQFALEFGYSRTNRLRRIAPAGSVACVPSDDGYDVSAHLLTSSDEPMRGAFVLDFGLRAYTEWMVLDDMEPPTAGEWLTGEISLGVDPFMYMDHLSKRPDIPPLIYTWMIHEIRLDTSATIRIDHGDPRYVGPDDGPMSILDPERRSSRRVDRTRMWDDAGFYRLRCSLVEASPVSSMARSGSRSPYGPIVI